ncbi:MAG: class I SAM-dependent rRNA methyltransferase [Candidatus Goldbacteria bacterium]|nr:class I SAM-dependent rRNA methyltransferase [Candidatus Goldiibacteriota bacterium]
MKKLQEVILKKFEEQRILTGHPWVFKSEIETIPDAAQDGDIVMVRAGSRKRVGLGYLNRKSEITVRMLDIAPKKEEYAPIKDLKSFLYNKINRAVKLREKITNTNAKRIFFSEADGIPGFIADLYNGLLVVQVNTLGAEKLKPMLVEALKRELKPALIYEKSISPSRKKEGLEQSEGVLWPEGAEIKPVIITENGLKFEVNVKSGTKTGFYLDQRDARGKLKDYIKEGARVLDCFCYTGAFSVYAKHFGAGSVTGVDISDKGLKTAENNMKLNNFDNYEFIKEDVFEFLRKQTAKKEKYDVIILDPPPFSKTKSEKEGAMAGHKELHVSALKLLNRGGVMMSFSCSHSVRGQELMENAYAAAADAKCEIEPAGIFEQAADHPYKKSIPETYYLKGIAVKKITA